ncbi:MAG: hypothetical protein HY248_04420, partial [Fimbriimonas ginsengisoli]|nr:hypothetical protein [Fimbriimonas ginsengisoli]
MTAPVYDLTVMAQLFWVAFVAAGLAAWPIYRWLLRIGSRQIISDYVPEHQAKQGTPTMGGMILLVGFLAAGAYAVAARLFAGPLLGVALVLFGGFALIGFLDDFMVPRLLRGKRGLGWKQKFVLQIAVSLGAAMAMRHGALTVGAVFAAIVILFYSNAFNFSDGMDGLAGGLLLLLAAGLAGLGLIEGRHVLAGALCAGLAGASLPFLFLNAPPARVFMGDVGSLPVGAVLGLVVAEFLRPGIRAAAAPGPILFGLQTPQPVAGLLQTGLPILLLSVLMIFELVPVPIQIASVKLTGKRVFPMTPIHHAFQKAGWPESRVVWLFLLVQLMLTALALSMALGQPGSG